MIMSMKTCDELLEKWNKCNGAGQLLVDHAHPLHMYLNINSSGNKELIIPTEKQEKRFESTYAIGVRNYENKNNFFFAIELLLPELETEFLSLCFDLIESSRSFPNERAARDALFATFKKWYELLSKRAQNILPLNEIKGLIGEIQFIIDGIMNSADADQIIDAWKIHKDASRDFVFDDSWSEIKAIESTKDYVTISSVEQLDSESDGNLVIYRLDSSNDNGSFDLNDKIAELKSLIGINTEAKLNQKLLAKGYSFNSDYCKYRFMIRGKDIFNVNDSFPRIRRVDIHPAIRNAKYDLSINLIRGWDKNG